MCDIWSLGITMIELAEKDAPNGNLHPMKVLFKVVTGPPPTLTDPHRWSPDFHGFLAVALTKEPTQRPTAQALLQHAFCARHATQQALVDVIHQARGGGRGGGAAGVPSSHAPPLPAAPVAQQHPRMQAPVPQPSAGFTPAVPPAKPYLPPIAQGRLAHPPACPPNPNA